MSLQRYSHVTYRNSVHLFHFDICTVFENRRKVLQPLLRSVNIYSTALDSNSKSGLNDISNFQNALWLTIITMTTVGYGDYYPRTTFGRIIDVILVIWGTFIVSLMVVVLTNTLNMDQSEKRALIVLNRLEAKKTLKNSAALLINHACKKYLLKKKRDKDGQSLTSEE